MILQELSFFENINNIKESMISALAYWKCNNLNAKADKGYEKNIVDSNHTGD